MKCSKCNVEIVKDQNDCGTGYGIDNQGNKVCYSCCGWQDILEMQQNDRATLYFMPLPHMSVQNYKPCKITNWPGTLEIRGNYKTGKHNIARKRFDVWFATHINGVEQCWHGVCYGNNTQILHCRKVRK